MTDRKEKAKKILIIDDDVDICTLISKFLERNGYETHICYRGETGLKALKDDSFDIILTDFRLPDEDGLSLLTKIKAIDELVPVIVITGYSDVKQAVKVIQNGAFEYVTKPIFPEDILKLIKQALATQKNRAKKMSTQPNLNQQPYPLLISDSYKEKVPLLSYYSNKFRC